MEPFERGRESYGVYRPRAWEHETYGGGSMPANTEQKPSE